MLFEVEKIVEDVLGSDTESSKYPKTFIQDVLLEYLTNSNASEHYMSFAFSPIAEYISPLKLSAIIDRAKQMKENRAKANRITAHDSITDATVIFDGLVNEIGGYTLFITPHNKLYDVLKKEPKKLMGRIFLETLSNGIDVQYLKVRACVPTWINSKSSKQLLRNLEYRTVKFDRVTVPLRAIQDIQKYRGKWGE